MLRLRKNVDESLKCIGEYRSLTHRPQYDLLSNNEFSYGRRMREKHIDESLTCFGEYNLIIQFYRFITDCLFLTNESAKDGFVKFCIAAVIVCVQYK